MKAFFSLLFLLAVQSLAWGQSDHVIEIGGQTLDLELGQEYTVEVDGQAITFTVTERDTLAYETDYYRFQFPKAYRPSYLELSYDINQVSILTAEGAGFVVQTYSSLDPGMLRGMMMTEVTKESISYGYEMTSDTYTRTIDSGQEVVIDRSVLSYRGDTSVYEVATISGKDEGLLVMTMVPSQEFSDEGQAVIDLFWNSFNTKLK